MPVRLTHLSLVACVFLLIVFPSIAAQNVPLTASAPRAAGRSFRGGRRTAELPPVAVNNPFAHLQVNASSIRDRDRGGPAGLGLGKRAANCAVAQPSSICTCTNGGAPTTPMFCSGACIDASSDANNCGSCGTVCPGRPDPGEAVARQTCQGAQCGCYNPGFPDTCGAGTGEYCTNVATSSANCGSCGTTCGSTGDAKCEAGSCRCSAVGETFCTDACYDLTSDPAHCGLCSVTCPAGDTCSHSICCSAGTTNCGGGVCSATASDNNNCGTCGTTCDPDYKCMGGSCVCSGTGYEICDAACVYVLSDDQNCGACGQTCSPDTTCRSGICVCSAGYVPCGSGCAVSGTCPSYGNIGLAYSSSPTDVTCYPGINLSTDTIDCASGSSTTPIAIGQAGIGPQNLPYYLIVRGMTAPNTFFPVTASSTLPTTSNGGYGHLIVSDPSTEGPGQGPVSGSYFGQEYYETDVWTISGTPTTLSSGQTAYAMSMVWDVADNEPYATSFVYMGGVVFWYLTDGAVPPALAGYPSVILYFIPTGTAPPGCGPASDPPNCT